MSVPFETIDRVGLQSRKLNPFSVSKIENALERLRDRNLYEDLATRIAPTKNTPEKEKIKNAINALRQRIGESTYSAADFGRLEEIIFDLLDITLIISVTLIGIMLLISLKHLILGLYKL